MHKIYASTGAFLGRANGRNVKLLQEILPKINCDGFEFMMDSDHYHDIPELVKIVKDTGAVFPVIHADKRIGEVLAQENYAESERMFIKNCEVAARIGSKIMVLHLWNGLISDSNIEANFSEFPRLHKTAKDFGIALAAENVLAHSRTPLTLLKMLQQRYPEANFTYDTKMADFDNENSVAFDDEHSWLWPRVRHVHVNDRAGAYRDWNSIKALHIGQGQVDFEVFFNQLKNVGYNGDFTVESTCLEADGTVRPELMNESLRRVRRLVEGLG